MPSSHSIFNSGWASGRARFDTLFWVGSKTLRISRLEMVGQNVASWNRIVRWLGQLTALIKAA